MTEQTATISTRTGAASGSNLTWNALRFLNIYRLLLAGILFSSTLLETPLKPFGEHAPQLFSALSAFYLVFAVTCGFALLWRWPPLRHQIYIQVLVDIAAITLLMHASGGANSGLGILLVVVVAGGGLFMPGRTAMFFAAVATLSTLSESVYVHCHALALPGSYTLAGMLGASYFYYCVSGQFLDVVAFWHSSREAGP